MIRCSKCDQYYPADSDVATSIRQFGECVQCKVANGDLDINDVTWIKFIRDQDNKTVH